MHPDPARLQVISLPCHDPASSFGAEVARGLGATAKRLPCRFFYDAEGSRLFEQICTLPEYYPTRTEEDILRSAAGDIIDAVGEKVALSEFGSGDSRKTRILIEALLERQDRLIYVPVDISVAHLEQAAHQLLQEYRRLWLTAIGGEYHDAIPYLPRHDGPRLILFLGGNIGNFASLDAAAFLARVRREMTARDRLLVGFDRVKPARLLEAAYDDAAGVTAAFNKNLLARINRELGGRFDLEAFAHHAPFIEAAQRVEMRLVSTRAQSVRIAALDREYGFRAGEAIHTEDCHKYTPGAFGRLASAAGLAIAESWTDARGWFTLALLARREAAPWPGGQP
jgi:L-histidine Nalpha-methyltransferase